MYRRCGHALETNGYAIRIFSTINFKKSMHYNPFAYIHYEAPQEEQNFATLIEFLNAMEVREDDETFQNPVNHITMPKPENTTFACYGGASRRTCR